jgi:hypothetical protein
VGTTSTTVGAGGSGVSGFRVDSDNGIVQAAASGNPSAIFNRTTSNGSVISCRYNGVEVGNIQTEGGDALVIQSGTTSGSGLLFHPSNGQIYPVRNSVKIDNAIDLGRSVNRFKDIYLSGGVNFSANANASGMSSEVLDDYEEGTFDPSFTPTSGSITPYSSYNTFAYTKVGRVVTITGTMATQSVSSPTGQLTFGNLPFSLASDTPNRASLTRPSIHIYSTGNGAPTQNKYYSAFIAFGHTSNNGVVFATYNSTHDENIADWFAAGSDMFVNFSYITNS